MKLFFRRLVGMLAKPFSPGFGDCHRCGRTWNIAKHHITEFGKGGCFPLCEACWSELTPIQRLPYYLKLFVGWVSHGGDNLNGEYWDNVWDAIEKAVLDGK
jgi:hypothetical protein